MLEKLNSIASGYKTYTSSAAFMAITMFLATKGIDTAVYTSMVDQLYAILSEAGVQLSAAYTAIIVILRKARG